MSTTPAGPVTEPWPFRACPACQGITFSSSTESDLVVFTCTGCGLRWRYLLGYLLHIDTPADNPPEPVISPLTTTPTARTPHLR